MNKKGFIATSLIYSFFLVFIALFLTIIADYLQDKVLLNTIEEGIKADLNKGIGCSDFKESDKLIFRGNYYPGINISSIDITGNTLYEVCPYACDSNILYIVEENNDCNIDDDLIEINMDGIIFTKETQDADFYTITGVKE